MKNSKRWTIGYLILTAAALVLIAAAVFYVDPYLHYHEPETERFFYSYPAADERFANYGILKQLDYDAVITGTSLSESFKPSEMDEWFGTKALKVPFYGSTNKELGDAVRYGLENHPGTRLVMRDLEIRRLVEDKDYLSFDKSFYPTYLYDSNPFNDVQYLFNREAVYQYTFPMILDSRWDSIEKGFISFDEYASRALTKFGVKTVKPEKKTNRSEKKRIPLTEEEIETLRANLDQNILSIARDFPEVDFYLFIPPGSAVWWQTIINRGDFVRYTEALKIAIPELLAYDNIHLFGFDDRTEITADLNHYEDYIHYGSWINSLLLRYMSEGEGLLTEDNYQEYLDTITDTYWNYDYSSLKKQKDYKEDLRALILTDEKITGTKRKNITGDVLDGELQGAERVEEGYKDSPALLCKGRLDREDEEGMSGTDIITPDGYIGSSIRIKDIEKYRHLSFYGKKNKDNGEPIVCIFNEEGERVGSFSRAYSEIDEDWHLYVVDLKGISGEATIVFNGGYPDRTGSGDSEYLFSRILLS